MATDETKAEEDAKADKDARPPRPERTVSTSHSTHIAGRELPFTATAGTMNLKDDKGEDRASVFFVSYVLDDPPDAGSRPVTFCFNGGPGSSSVWLQFGALGPRRVDIPDTVSAPPPPYKLVDNPHGLLDRTDLVFIDPVGTGFSRATGKHKDADFHAVQADIDSVGEFIWRWVSRNHRWNSPKFLAGESYGTTRAAGLVNHLQAKGMAFNGLVLVSLATDFQTFMFEPGNDLPHVLFLPSYAAAAWYHDRLPERPDDLHAFLDEVRRFAVDEYAPALLQGTRLSVERRDQLAARLARYTGLPVDELARRELRIHYLWFARTVLGPGHHTIGRLDGRYVGPDLDPNGLMLTRDPSYDAALGAYTATVNDFVRRTLEFETDDAYHVLSIDVNRGWNWTHGDRLGYVNTTEELRQALVTNPHLKLLLCNGIYDLATPFFAAEHTADHLSTSREMRENVRLTYYDAGHMMYFHPPSLRQLRADLVAFYGDACAKDSGAD